MDELDRIARDAVDELRSEAAHLADTEQALAEVRSGVRLAPVVALEGRSRRRSSPVLVAAAVVAVLAVGAAVWTAGDDDARIAPADTTSAPDVSTDESGPKPTTAPMATPSTVPGSVPGSVPTTAPPFTATTSPDGFTGIFLRHGVRIPSASVPGDVVGSRSVDTFGFANSRADSVERLIFADARVLRITLGSLDQSRYGARSDAPELGSGGWQVTGLRGEVAEAVGRSVGPDTWITVEALRTWDPAVEDWGEAAFSLVDVRAVVAAVQYDPTADTRPMTAGSVGGGVGAPCTDPTSITGATDRDLVLFTCDGVLGVYDGATGDRTEVIRTFDDWVNADPADPESIYASYVESIAVSPDARTVYFTVGPEPVSGTTYRYELGSGVEPELVGDGRVGDIGPDWVALTTAMPGIDLLGSRNDDLSTSQQIIDTLGMFVNGGSWSPDGGLLAVVSNGAIGVVDWVDDGSIVLRAPLAGQAYTQAWFDAEGRLMALVDDGTTSLLAVVAIDPARITSGNVAPESTEPYGPRGSTDVDGLRLEPTGRLVDGDTVVASGVVVAALIP